MRLRGMLSVIPVKKDRNNGTACNSPIISKEECRFIGIKRIKLQLFLYDYSVKVKCEKRLMTL